MTIKNKKMLKDADKETETKTSDTFTHRAVRLSSAHHELDYSIKNSKYVDLKHFLSIYLSTTWLSRSPHTNFSERQYFDEFFASMWLTIGKQIAYQSRCLKEEKYMGWDENILYNLQTILVLTNNKEVADCYSTKMRFTSFARLLEKAHTFT